MKPHESPRINKKSIRGNSGDSWPVWNRGISEHMRDIKNQAEKPIMRHCSGHKVDDMHVSVLQSLGREDKAYRQLVEEKWSIRLGTKTPLLSVYNR